MEDRLVFLVSPLRSGSTLLQRMLSGHDAIYSRSECHLLTPLAHLGYFRSVDAAPYHVGNTERAAREVVERLPRGEEDYLEACRAYADRIYAGLLEGTGKRLLLDKTPAYALVGDFVRRLYPEARYVVLTRHPMAVLHSFATTFAGGDYRRAWEKQPVLDRYVPAVADMLRADVSRVHVRYEDVVADPERQLYRIFDFLGLEHDPSVVRYGEHDDPRDHGLGDPKVHERSRPSEEPVLSWARAMARSRRRAAFARGVAAGLDPADLEAWGYPAESLFDPLEEARGRRRSGGVSRALRGYRLKRRLLGAIRRLLRRLPPMRGLVRGLRDGCERLLAS